jgi:HSP90 family molecular chaperone
MMRSFHPAPPRPGTAPLIERLEVAKAEEKAELIGQFGVGFYPSFMAADRVGVISRRADEGNACCVASHGGCQEAYSQMNRRKDHS